jgi:AraC-like DNA-binding protein
VERVLPDGCPELIVHLLDPWARRVDGRWRRQPRAFLAAALSRPWELRAGPRVRTLGLRFRPGAPRAFFDVVMAAAADREVPLGDLVGPGSARALQRGLSAAPHTADRFAFAESWLAARLDPRRLRALSARPAVARILATRGSASMDAVAATLGWNRRRLERAFRRDLGIRPKLFARTVRLNAVLATLDRSERRRAVDLALDAGYFDEAHLLRDFRHLAGRSPRAGRDADGEMARHFTDPDRLRALLRG